MKISGILEGQVLQRQGFRRGARAHLSGGCRRDGTIYGSIFSNNVPLKGWTRRRIGAAVKGRFNASLSAIPIGGPYRLILSDSSGKEFASIGNFFVGDVWLLAGQSNMEGYGNRSGAAVPHPLIRAFSMRREWRLAEDPLHVLRESPDICHHSGFPYTPEEASIFRRTTPKGVGIGIFFGREMLNLTGVPQGLICTAHHGTSMRQWSPSRKKLGGQSLYHSMLTSVKATGQSIAGVLWYQGENEVIEEDVSLYTQRMKRLVSAFRRDLGQPGLPWVMAQIGRTVRDDSQGIGKRWNAIQEQQRSLPEKIRQLEVIPTIDLELDDIVHIASKSFPLLAQRFASAVGFLTKFHGRQTRSPQLRSIEAPAYNTRNTGASSYIALHFDQVEGALHAEGIARGFSIWDAYGKERPTIYKTTLHGSTVRLHLASPLLMGDTVSYGRGLDPICNIHDARGYPLPVFGPVSLAGRKEIAMLPFINLWKVSAVVPCECALPDLDPKEIRSHLTEVRSYPDGFVNEHLRWAGKSGHGYFSTRIGLSESMKLDFLIGYDSPFHLWIDGKPFFSDPSGTNPALPDERRRMITLDAGTHELIVAMDLNHGAAWGFHLRAVRKDVSATQVSTRQYAVPVILEEP